MEAADRFGESLFNGHAFGVAVDEPSGLVGGVVGEDQGGVIVAEAPYSDLAQRLAAAAHGDGGFIDLGFTVPAFPVEGDGGPGVVGERLELCDERPVAGPQRQEGETCVTEGVESGPVGDFGVEHQQFGGGLPPGS